MLLKTRKMLQKNNNDVTVNVTKKDYGVIENITVNHDYSSYNIPKEQKR